MVLPDPTSVTLLLDRVGTGDRDAYEQLYEIVYDDLRARAVRMLGRSAGSTLQATALVHEAWMKLHGPAGEGMSGRSHFLAVAAKAMRSVLIDHARAKGSTKRASDDRRVVLDEALAVYSSRVPDLLALDDELRELAKLDEQLARIVELRFFGGLSIAETADALGIGHATVERGWSSARAFLAARLKTNDAEDAAG